MTAPGTRRLVGIRLEAVAELSDGTRYPIGLIVGFGPDCAQCGAHLADYPNDSVSARFVVRNGTPGMICQAHPI
jgi:hypothetical protein